MNKLKKLTTAFTLIELLVVISIIGLLTAIALPNMMGMRERARDSQRKAALNELKTALRLYYNDYQEYPLNNADYQIVGCGNTPPTTCEWGEAFSRNSATYMKQLPKDQVKTFKYERYNSGESFRAWIVLENTSDSEVSASQAKCNIASPEAGAYYVCSD